MSELQGGQKVRVLLAQALFGKPQALLLDEPTNYLDLDSIHWLQDFLNRYEGTLIIDLARPAFSEQCLYPHRRHRLRDHHHLHRRLRRHGAAEDADALAAGIAERAAREEDRAAERVHRALLGRNAFQPGDVAKEGSGAAADERTGAVEHSAPLHSLRSAASFGQARSGVRRT